MIAISLAAIALTHSESLLNVDVHAPLVKLGDLIDLTEVPIQLRTRAATIEVAQMQPASVLVSRQYLIRRIRAQLPALGAWAKAHIVRDYRVSYRQDRSAAKATRCLKAVHGVLKDDILRTENFVEVLCEPLALISASRYIAAQRSVRASRDIAQDEVVPRFVGYGLTSAYAGDPMTVVAISGRVTIARKTIAMQSARLGEDMLVRTVDGEIFSVAYRKSE